MVIGVGGVCDVCRTFLDFKRSRPTGLELQAFMADGDGASGVRG